MCYFHPIKDTYNSDMDNLSELKRQIGCNIRGLRNQKKWSQDALAEAADLSCKFIGEVERGTVNPSLDTLRKIANALDVEIAALFLTDRVYMLTGKEIANVKSAMMVLDDVLSNIKLKQ